MKKIISILLTLVMLLGIIPLTSLTAFAASENGLWNEVWSYSWYDSNNREDREVKLYKEDIKSWWGYTSRVKIQISSVTYNGYGRVINNTKSYTTGKYQVLSKTPLSVKEICARDKNLKKSNVYMNIENILLCEWMRDDAGGCLQYYALKSWNNTVYNTTKGAIYSSISKALGSGSKSQDIYCLIMDINDAKSSTKQLIKSVGNLLTQMELVTNANKRNSIMKENSNALYNSIKKIAN